LTNICNNFRLKKSQNLQHPYLFWSWAATA